ncbi:hypothetical protein Rsub_08764 [Raphidocelis subcapitata]|uniref:Uncharacterized protein n=1 Tax=Raphidocelis subcapitata TaxID=307507 RepID=A0A2V0P9G9_9CHLO|nr:hypothetical protein Rsub_08764 [Raphidocelis subcapitata]|eukprot:GBF96219.1 hypothetical protein Rsub_08764 [Raphidocelis subcapitata]
MKARAALISLALALAARAALAAAAAPAPAAPLLGAAAAPRRARRRAAAAAGAALLLPLGDDDGRIDGLLRYHRAPSYWRRRRRAVGVGGALLPEVHASGAQPAPPPPPPPPYAGACPPAARPLLDAIDAALSGGARFVSQRGSVDWGLVEAESSGGDARCASNAASGCSASNPSAPYGLVVLPLAPGEDLAAKLASNVTPPYVKENLGDASLYSGGRSPVWQLARGEVVVVAGCTPAAEASRYFGATGYVYSSWRPAERSWLTAFASTGDSLSIARTPGELLPRALGRGAPPPPGRAVDGRLGVARLQGAAAGGAASASNSGGGGASSSNTRPRRDPFDGFFVVAMGASPAAVAAARAAVADALAAAGANATVAAAAAAAAAAGVGELPIPGPIFGEALGLAPTGNYMMLLLRCIVGGAGQGAFERFRSYAAADALRAWRLTPRDGAAVGGGGGGGGGGGERGGGEGGGVDDSYPLTRVVPRVPPPHAASAALSAAAAAAAVDGGSNELPRVGPLVAGALSRAAVAIGESRAAPAPEASAGGQQSRLTPLEAAFSRAAAAAAAVDGSRPEAQPPPPLPPAPTVQSLEGPAWPPPPVRSMEGPAAALRDAVSAALGAGGLDSEAPLQPAYDYLIGRIALSAARAGARVAHALGAAPPFDLMGVDWGADCLSRGLDFCNGDNRDATYVTSWPLVTLGRPGQRLVLAGVNHATAGLAAFGNVALTDPLQRRGLSAFDDTAMPGSADAFLEGTPYAWAAPLLFAVTYAHDCAGIPHCKELRPGGAADNGTRPAAPAAPSLGAAARAAFAPLLLVERSYVNPATGVGPGGAALLPFHAMVLTPAAVALPGDSRPRYDARIFAAPPGGGGGGGGEADGGGAGAGGGGGSVGDVALRSSGAAAGADGAAPAGGGAGPRPGAVEGGACVRAMVGAAQCASGSWAACCDAMEGWAAAGCWVSQEGRVLLGSMPAVLGPAVMRRLSASCGV